MARPYTLMLLAIAGPLSGQERLEQAPTPAVHLLYPAPQGSVFDRNCTELLRSEAAVDPRWVEEAVRREAEFQRRWDSDGPAYLATVFKAIGQPFPYREMQAAMTVCPIDSMSLPLLINIRGFLHSAGNQRPDWFFPLLVFHELMHTYTRVVNASSALRIKYATETPLTLNHLHVLALEKFVLTSLGKTQELRWLDHDYKVDAPAGYRRAWEIVNAEGVDAFLTELRAARP